MVTHSHDDKVKITLECSADERTYIKILAAKARMTISEFVLSYIRPDLPCEPNEETKKAMLDSRNKRNLGHAKTVTEFWEEMGLNPNA